MFDTDESPDEDALLAALVALQQRKQRKQPAAPERNAYSRVIEHFERRGKRLTGERMMTEQLIRDTFEKARALPAPPAPLRVEAVGLVGGAASAHVQIVNTTRRPVTPVWVIGSPADERPLPPIAFAPADPVLAPGQSQLIHITVDLATWREARSLGIALECRTGVRRDHVNLIVTAQRGDR